MARRDDLLLVFGDNCTRCWKQIIQFGEQAEWSPGEGTQGSSDYALSMPMHDAPLEFPDNELIQDARGVRLARIEND